MKSVRDANLNTTTFGNTSLLDGGYDPSGQPTKVTDPTGAFKSFEYDFLGRLAKVVDRNSQPWSFEHDLRGNLLKTTDPLGRFTLRCYDANDNEVLTVRPNAGSTATCSWNVASGNSTSHTYDARDLLESATTYSDGQLRKTSYVHYPDGELQEIREPRSFDASGNLLPPSQRQVARYERYPNNRVKAFIDEEASAADTNTWTDIVYTPNGLPWIVKDPIGSAGRHAITYAYNGKGQVKTLLESGHASAAFSSHTYNLHGERTSTKTPKHTTTEFAYDKLGRLLTTTDGNKRSSTRIYDAVGNLVRLSQPTGAGLQTIINYTYSARNEIGTESDPVDPNHEIRFEYDSEGRQTFRRDFYDGLEERRQEQIWTADGRLKERVAAGVNAQANLPGHRTVFDSDANGNVSQILTTSGSTTISSISSLYTSADELKSLTETASGVSKTSSYTYAPDGFLSSRTVDGLSTTYEYFRNGSEKTAAPWGGQGSLTSTYFQNGALRKQTFPNGSTLDQTYDLADRIVSRIIKKSDGTITLSSWSNVVYDENDNRTSESVVQRQFEGSNPAQLAGTASYSYDNLDRLSGFQHPFEDPTKARAYVLDDAGNMVSDQDFAYTYASNRLTRRAGQERVITDQSGTFTYQETFTYLYDHFGNQARETKITTVTDGVTTETTTAETSTSYDAASHAKRVTSSDGSWVEYSYDGLDRMIRRETSGGEVTLFLHDRTSDELVLETDGAGAAKVRYILDSDGEPLASETASARAYYITDLRGNLTQLLDQAQEAKATFGYDPFGKEKPALTNITAGWDSRLRFQLAPRDPKTGAYSIGPRLYDPQINRFVGADFYVAAAANLELQLDPLTGNRYLYAGANPANLIDDGHHPNKCPRRGRCKKFRFSRRAGQGDIRIALFIKTSSAGFGLLEGDNRSWDSNTNSSNNRIYLDLHLGSGEGFIGANKSCFTVGPCRDAKSWSDDGNRLTVTELPDGTLQIRIRGVNSALSGSPAIDATFRVDSQGRLSFARDGYPWLEAYSIKGGKKRRLYRDPPSFGRSINLFRRPRYE